MKVFFTDPFQLSLPDNHSFPIEKYGLLRERIVAARLVEPEALCLPDAASDEALLRVHERGYHGRIVCGELTAEEVRRIGLPWSLKNLFRSSLPSSSSSIFSW